VLIIKQLQSKNKIILAACGKSFDFLKLEFPDIQIIKSPNFNVSYSPTPFFMPLKFFLLLPKLIFYYFKNQNWIKKFTAITKIDLIISDNNFGFFSKKIYSIFITHQIHIETPNYLSFLKPFIFFINKKNIEKFNELWIPDVENSRICNKLSDNKGIKIKTKYIGLLSRFSKTNLENFEKNDILILISGPEPQRTILEKKLLFEIEKTNLNAVFLTGKIENSKAINKNIKIYNHLNTNDLQQIILSSEIIIARAGYSTIMDLITLQKTAIIIPTPGQTEQEYLAKKLHKKEMFFYVKQNNFNFEQSFREFIENKTKLENNIKKIKFDNNLQNIINNL
jgi:uncharacterized protein (TIGR00661 family)